MITPAPTASLLDYLIAKHKLRYAERIRKGLAGESVWGAKVNVEECRRYLELWKSIESKKTDLTRLTPEEVEELEDAIADERV